MDKIYRNFTLIVALFCVTILTICYFYGTYLGLNNRITAGAELDASGISIALSRLWFGLHKGYVGYQIIYNTLMHVLTGGRSPNDPDGFPLLSNPQIIAQAFAQVKAIIPTSLPAYSVLSSEFISINMEDHGIADFYMLAFLLFGIKPTAMYNFYFFLFSLSIGIFLIEYRKQIIPLVLLALIVGSFPIFFFSDNFSVFVPSINANRFIPTLGFIPILYIVCMHFQSSALNRMQYVRLICQCLLFAFVLSVRKSAQWELLILVFYTLMIATPLLWNRYKNKFKLDDLRILKYPLFTSVVLLFVTVTLYQTIQGMMLNPIYKTDCSPPQHAFWHSAFISLAMNPDFEKIHPYTRVGDGMAIGEFEQLMKDRGLDPICHVSNTYLFGLHELVIKDLFLNLIFHHKLFALKLYGVYKPWAIFNSYWFRIKNITLLCFLYSFAISVFAGILLSKNSKQNIKLIKNIFLVNSLFLLGSWMPSLLAYPSRYNNDDFWMFYIWLSLSICAFSYWIAAKRNS